LVFITDKTDLTTEYNQEIQTQLSKLSPLVTSFYSLATLLQNTSESTLTAAYELTIQGSAGLIPSLCIDTRLDFICLF